MKQGRHEGRPRDGWRYETALASERSSFHSCIFCGSIVSQPPSISSTLMPSNRQRTWMRFSYLRERG